MTVAQPKKSSSKPKQAKAVTAKSVVPSKQKTPAAQQPPVKSQRPAWQQRLAPAYHRASRLIARTSLPELFLISSFCMARYLQNSDFSYPSEVVLNIVLLWIIATIFFGLFRLLLGRKRLLAAHIASLLLGYELYAYDRAYPTLHRWLNHLIPGNASFFTQAIVVTIGMAVIFGALGWLIDYGFKRLKPLQAVPLFKLLLFVICFIFISELGKVGLRVWQIRHDLAYKHPASSLQQDKAAIKSKPNIYYLLFDRYANATTLKNDYNYDNSNLMNFLGKQGFVTRDNAYANYPFTMMSVSSTLAMDYHTKIGAQFKNDAKPMQAAFAYRSILDHPPVAQELQKNGYNYNQVSSWWDFTRNIPQANDQPSDSFRLRIFGKNYWLSDLQRDIVNKSILSPLLLHGITFGKHVAIQYQLDRNPVQNFYAETHAVTDIANASSTSKPQFTFAHFLSPHDPYIFDKNGNTPSYDQNRTDFGADENVKYINQLTYLNTQIKQLVSTIRSKDPSAVIVLQADEGPYPKQFRGELTADHYYNPINLPLQNMRQKFGVLASYYLPGVSAQAKTSPIDSSVNAFRYVLDHYLGYQMPLLPDCQFAVGDKYNLYTYQLVSGKLKGTAEPTVCKQYQ